MAVAMHDLARLLAPRSIAVVGGAAAERVVRQNLKLGFEGNIWPVHPTRREIAGVTCFPSLDALPAVPDAAFLGVNRDATIDAVRQLSTMGSGGAVCYGSGFAEAGDAERQDDLIAAASDLPIFGPNCYGFVNTFDRVALWPDEHGCPTLNRGTAFVSQSGNVACNLTFQRRGVRMGMMLTVGNQAVLGVEDCIDAFLDDDRVTTIGLFIEAVRDAQRFATVAQRAQSQGVPIVALQTGRSAVGAAIAATHTGSMSGRAAAYDAMFERYGVCVVNTPAELLETVKLFDAHGPLRGPRLVSMSCSGGEASLIADHAAPTALRFEPFEPEHQREIESTLTDLVHVSNPFDYHTFMWNNREAMAATFTAVMRGDHDATLLILDAPTAPGLDAGAWYVAADAFADAADATGTRGVVVATMAECIDDQFQQRMLARGLTPLLGLHESVVALNAAAGLALRSSTRPTMHLDHDVPHHDVRACGPTVTVLEDAAKAQLRAANLPVPTGIIAARADVGDAAHTVGYPVTLKAIGLAHKSESGGVRVGLPDEPALLEALNAMPDASQYLVEETINDTVAEILVSVRRDPPVGWLVTIGFGGVTTELWNDAVHLLAPVTSDMVAAAVNQLRCAPLLNGFRGRPQADVRAFCDLVVATATFAVQHNVVEIELNPVLVRPVGATIVDALIIKEAQ